MEQAILTDRQRAVIAAVAIEPRLSQFYLSGGTALSAYHLHHRISDDLDFFSMDKPDRTFLLTFVQHLKDSLGALEVRFEYIYDRNLYFLSFADGYELKLEFTYYPYAVIERQLQLDGILIDSLCDITANKLMAMLERFDPKDFADLFYLLQDRALNEVRLDAEVKFKIKISDMFLGSELAKVSRIEALPKMLKPLSVVQLKEFFSDQAREFRTSILE